MENKNYMDWALNEKLIVKFATEYKPNWKKPTKKDFKGEWIGHYFDAVKQWYEEYGNTLDDKSNNFRQQFKSKKKDGFKFRDKVLQQDIKEWRELYKDQLASINKQRDACKRNYDKYSAMKINEMNKAYRGTRSAAGLPDDQWKVII